MKYEFPIRFLCSVFVNADDIVPKPTIVSDLFKKLERFEVVPTIAREQGPTGTRERIAFSHSASGLFVVLSGMRFDVSIQPLREPALEMQDFSGFILKSSEILTTLIEYFERKGTRLACIQEGMYKTQTLEEEALEISNKLFKFPPIYEENRPFEWEWRCVSEIKREFGSKTERTNTLLKILKTQGSYTFATHDSDLKKSFDGIRIDLDINTTQDDLAPRFDIEDIKSFFELSRDWHQKFENEIITYLNLP